MENGDYLVYYGFYLYLALAVAAVLYRRPVSLYAILHVISIPALFAAYFFGNLSVLFALFFHLATLAVLAFKERRFLPAAFTACNLYLYLPFAHYGPLEPGWFLEYPMHYNVFVIMHDMHGLSLGLLTLVILPVILVKTGVYLYRRSKKPRV